MSEQKQRIYEALKELNIKYEAVEHEPVFTMEDMDRLGLPEKGVLCKNLFLRDSKENVISLYYMMKRKNRFEITGTAVWHQQLELRFRRTS